MRANRHFPLLYAATIGDSTLSLHGNRTHTWSKLAATAQARGHQVTVLERNSWLGGKAAVLNLPSPDGRGNFRFDMGPTILTVPRVLRRIFAEAGRNQQQEMPLIRLDPQWRCFFDGSKQIDLIENVEDIIADLDQALTIAST